MSRLAVVLVSGGMDSTTLAYLAKEQYDELICLSVLYGQRHDKEIEFARATAERLEAEHIVMDVSGIAEHIPRSALTGGVTVPHGHYAEENMASTVVPFRNPIFLSLAMAVGSGRGADAVGAAVHAGDHFVYPDCRPGFVYAFNTMKREALIGLPTPTLLVPFLRKTKAEIAVAGERLGVPWKLTWSCYEGGDIHCGRCGTCVERREAFALAYVKDPTQYRDDKYWKEVTDRT